LRGSSRERKSDTKLRTEARELRSRGKIMISDPGHSEIIRALASSAAFRLRAGRIKRAPRFAKTRAVSAPIPDVAPVIHKKGKENEKKNRLGDV
jgi:hypothetical protein